MVRESISPVGKEKVDGGKETGSP